MRGWSVTCVALVFGTALALFTLLVLSPVRAQEASNCENRQGPQVPEAVKQDADW